MKRCPECGQDNLDTAAFCAHCGKSLAQRTSPVVPPLPALNGPAAYPAPGATPYTARRLPDNLCRVCNRAVPAYHYECPRCQTPVGTVMNINDPTYGSTIPVSATPPAIENTSGQHGIVPPEIRRGWNWGAAFLALFWALAHQLWWIAGLAFLLIVAWFAAVSQASRLLANLVLLIWLPMILMLGWRGNALAWQSRRFESAEQFRVVQATWSRIFLGLCAALLALFGFFIILIALFSVMMVSSQLR